MIRHINVISSLCLMNDIGGPMNHSNLFSLSSFRCLNLLMTQIVAAPELQSEV